MSRLDYHDGRFWLDDAPFFLIAADYQYYRDRRENWEDRLRKLKQGGVNCITFYIPWRHHLYWEQGERKYDFDGRTMDSRDVIGFMRRIESLDFWMIAKPGPFVHSELNVGGLPDLVSPTFAPGIPPARRHHGGPVTWCYDGSALPAPWDMTFDGLVREWLYNVRDLLVPFSGPDSRLIALQLNDETVYCTSNDPPWNIGYESSGIRLFHQLLADRYGDITTYNRLHGTDFDSFDFVQGPRLPSTGQPTPTSPPSLNSREQLLQYVDWAEYQWQYRRRNYSRYRDYLGIDLPHLTNFAGITPPIDENVPDAPEMQEDRFPADFARLYPDWWFAMNRIESDRDVYEYGIISWLGVAAYDTDVFDRYINTARRARGPNMEENWGFGMLYDAKSKYPLIPFFQTLVSVAGGATGYDIYCGVSTDYWDATLDSVTKKQYPTFPSDAPISERGECRPMYDTARMLNRWFADHGSDLLRCRLETDIGYLLYAPYAAVSSWVPDERYWNIEEHAIPRCGVDGFEPFATALQEAGYSFAMFELEAASDEQWQSCRALAVHSAFFMSEPAQRRLADHLAGGGRLFISGQLPTVDLQWRPCTILNDAVQRRNDGPQNQVVHQAANLFTSGHLIRHLEQVGIRPQLRHSDNMRAYLYQGDGECFLFFFNFDRDGVHQKWIQVGDTRVDLQLGSKTCGALRIRGGRLVAYLVKGTNEVECLESEVRIQVGDQVVLQRGDFSSSDP